MKNNYWEEQNMKTSITDFHETVLEKMEIPEWINVKCPYCKSDLDLNSIRSFGIKLNTRNLGDLFVEIHCKSCQIMDTVYFRSEINKIQDFIGFLSGESTPQNEPILEKEMYEMNYNNVFQKMIEKDVEPGEII